MSQKHNENTKIKVVGETSMLVITYF